MLVPMWILLVVIAAGLVLTNLWIRSRRGLVLIRRDNEQLRTLVAHRMEHPNVFSHEVRTPLALIQGAAELLSEETPGPLTERQREFVETILDNTAQMSALAENMLAEARVDAQLVELHRSQVEIRGLVRDAVNELRRLTHTALEMQNSGRRILLAADANLLRQALWNLVNNAVRHAGEGAVVTVQVTESEGCVVICVSDDGAGMSQAEREQLFRPFTGDLTAMENHGTGLGMMVTQRVIEAHGGRVLVDTLAGRGTSIFCTIPIVPSPAVQKEDQA
ncbi:sensor histidine kinase [Acidipropionibacterium jensenii]|uniref:sensor histidine kinase n=1 Tax=Acidipropionibacterium jensenii TaxID=1749 RepID=UPI002648E1AA|nr:HAMP domain-containing sensor histidine kinase [Acidipropionibacterium jensenii]MDN5976605.1 HAMP domain-containing histidine kinase [Acidipropionibacterium jensenii]MDN5996994.1 HAMP domain-containing histidine kinase [Acidipropionibacterium jensenii]MDN6021122.1 HAMP domain-containing histidine kinase [Acidipropionibacterium jensenii]MDN6426305.1 HAMP domain-containing histidine kinase [Acidipropionibacterium jensenii]MDN6442114.1 HAMP domain-containing histidine kinase [Acidipropionibact